MSADGVLALAPYRQAWGYLQSVSCGEAQLYDWIYKCISEAFSVTSRTVGGKTYTVDGGNEHVLSNDVHWLVIPMRQFDIPAEESGNLTAFRAVRRVCGDNQMLLGWACPDVNSAAVDWSGYEVVNDGEYLDAYRLQYPHSDLSEKRAEIRATISEIDALVQTETGCSIVNKPESEADKLAVATVLHDWILTNVSNNRSRQDSTHWAHCAYSVLRQVDDPSDGRKADCAGFGAAFQLLCEQYGINCLEVLGGAGDSDTGATGTRTNHAWNMLSLSLPIGTYTADPALWYAADVRFDEYVKDSFSVNDPDIKKYFMQEGARVVPSSTWTTRRYFLSSKVYYDDVDVRFHSGSNNYDYTHRANNAIGYPVEVPGAELQGGGAA